MTCHEYLRLLHNIDGSSRQKFPTKTFGKLWRLLLSIHWSSQQKYFIGENFLPKLFLSETFGCYLWSDRSSRNKSILAEIIALSNFRATIFNDYFCLSRSSAKIFHMWLSIVQCPKFSKLIFLIQNKRKCNELFMWLKLVQSPKFPMLIFLVHNVTKSFSNAFHGVSSHFVQEKSTLETYTLY